MDGGREGTDGRALDGKIGGGRGYRICFYAYANGYGKGRRPFCFFLSRRGISVLDFRASCTNICSRFRYIVGHSPIVPACILCRQLLSR